MTTLGILTQPFNQMKETEHLTSHILSLDASNYYNWHVRRQSAHADSQLWLTCYAPPDTVKTARDREKPGLFWRQGSNALNIHSQSHRRWWRMFSIMRLSSIGASRGFNLLKCWCKPPHFAHLAQRTWNFVARSAILWENTLIYPQK